MIQRFLDLGALLEEARPLWEPRPFALERVPWEETLPQLSRWLRALSLDAVEDLDQDALLPAAAPGSESEETEAWRRLSCRVGVCLSDALARGGQHGEAVRAARLAAQVKPGVWGRQRGGFIFNLVCFLILFP